MPVSIRLEPEEERRLRLIARRRRTSLSEVVREAIAGLTETATSSARPYDHIADLVGSVTGLPDDLSEKTGDRFFEALRKARSK